MKHLKAIFVELINKPYKALFIAIGLNVASFIVKLIFISLQLPENPTEADNLSIIQILTGYFLSLVYVTLGLLAYVVGVVFIISQLRLFLKMLRPKKQRATKHR